MVLGETVLLLTVPSPSLSFPGRWTVADLIAAVKDKAAFAEMAYSKCYSSSGQASVNPGMTGGSQVQCNISPPAPKKLVKYVCGR